MNPLYLVWCDLETTGLCNRKDSIVEVGAYVVPFNDPFNLESAPTFSRVLNVTDWTNSERVVIDMHASSGLLLESLLSTYSLTQFGKDFTDFLEPYGDRLVLAGSSVHFDLSFLKASWFWAAKTFSHQVYDTTALSLYCRSQGMPQVLTSKSAHRALQDIHASVAQARACHEWLQSTSNP